MALPDIGQPPQFLPLPGNGLGRREHIQILMRPAPQVPIPPECVPQKVQTSTTSSYFHHTRFLAVDLQSELPSNFDSTQPVISAVHSRASITASSAYLTNL